MNSKARVERAARIADRDFDTNIEAYLAMYVKKDIDKSYLSMQALATFEVLLWLAAAGTWGTIFYLVVYL